MIDRYLCKAKRTDNGEWVEGYPVKFGGVYWIYTGKINKIAPYTNGYGSTIYPPIRYMIEPETLCQCTGLPDKDKTQMYENDIVRANGGVHGVIRFGKYGDMKTDYGFYIEWDKSQPYWRNDICYWQNEIKVIGSYIDNPELLEGGAE